MRNLCSWRAVEKNNSFRFFSGIGQRGWQALHVRHILETRKSAQETETEMSKDGIQLALPASHQALGRRAEVLLV